VRCAGTSITLGLLLGLALMSACAGSPPTPDAADTAPPVPCNGACTGICQGLCVGACTDRNDAGTCSTPCEGTCIGSCLGSCPSNGGGRADAGSDGKLDVKLDTRVLDSRNDGPDALPPDTAQVFEPGPPEAYGAWTNQSRVNSASWPALGHTGAMVFDTRRGRVVMFGGFRELSNNTWEWEARRSSWTLMQQRGGVRPSARMGHAMTFDPVRFKVIMHGGIDETGASNSETWEWDGVTETWTQRGPGPIPSRWGHGMVFDESVGTVVLFGGAHRDPELGDGELLDTWQYDPATDRWTNMTYPLPGVWPRARHGHAMAYDYGRKLIVVYGGELGNLGMVGHDLWEWSSTVKGWRERTPSPLPTNWPGPRSFSTLAYIGGGQMVLLGSESPGFLRWLASPNQWFNITPAMPPTFPGPRMRALAAWDHTVSALVAVGGQVLFGPQVLTDTWHWVPQ
jgi:hypothetical protein